MKISPVAQGGQPAINPNEGRSAGTERLARATAAAGGQSIPESTGSPQADAILNQRQKITMRTQRSIYRNLPTEAPAEAPAAPESDSLDTSEQVQQDSEVTEPMSPQFAALAKAKRALQAKEREIAVREAALKSDPAPENTGYTKDQIKANALSILREAGVTNDDLTNAILNEQSDFGPGYTRLEAEIKAMKESLENQTKSLSERDQAAEKQVLGQIRKDVDQLIAQGDDFEAVRAAGEQQSVVKLIHEVWKKGWPEKGIEAGHVLDLKQAAQFIDDQLVDDFAPYAGLKKVQSRLKPAVPEQPQPAKPSAVNTKIMRTLTNRDGASLPTSPRERALAAFYGKLK